MRAVVHIGSPKTGTSTLQAFLHDNSQAMASQGVRYQRNVTGRGSQWEYPLGIRARLGLMLQDPQERSRYGAETLDTQRRSTEPHLAALATFADRWPEPLAVFSSEHILPWLSKKDAIEAFDAVFRPHFEALRYVAYIRSPVEAIASQYSETLKRGWPAALDTFVQQRKRVVDPRKMLKPWVEAVGRDRLDLRLFDPKHLRQGDIIDDFCAVIGVDPAEMTRPPRLNTALTSVGAECLSALNKQIPELLADGRENPLRRDLLDAVQTLTAQDPKLRLQPWQIKAVCAATAEGTRWLRDTFFPEQPQLFDPAEHSAATLSPSEIRERALEVMTEIIIQLRLRDLPELSYLDRRRANRRTAEPQPTPAPRQSPVAANRPRPIESAQNG